jgi:pimeloyl-ACP methyl ester carboxylesterase
VLGFDHWTLSKSPSENAQLLLSQLPTTWRSDEGPQAPFEIDVICHSRGGLVARALTETLKHQIRIRRVVMVGVPNAGTGLADPSNWGTMADILINQVSQDPTGLLGRLSSFLFYLVAQGIEQQVPGLQAMRPLSGSNRSDLNPFLSELQKPDARSGTEYFVVASNYVPDRDTLNLRTILQEIGDETIDRFFETPNDLVVETASMWALDKKSSWTEKIQALPPENILLFNTLRGGPENLTPELQSGVHHTNYFLNRSVRDFIREVLER